MLKEKWFGSFLFALGLSTVVAFGNLGGCVPAPTAESPSNEKAVEVAVEKAQEPAAEPVAEPTKEADAAVEAQAEPTPEPTPEPQAEAQNEPQPELPPEPTQVVWYGQVQKLVQDNCQVCHSNGQIAPFQLSTYDEVKAKAALVKWSVENRRMPPWMPAKTPDCPDFAHSPALSDSQIKMLTDWIDNGMPEGDPTKSTQYVPKQDTLSHVDVEVGAQVAHTPSGKTPDDYHCFITQPILASTATEKDLIGMQVLPGANEMVHHVLIYRVNSGFAQTLLTDHPTKEWACTTGELFTPATFTQATLIGGWAPGMGVILTPQDTGFPVQPGDHLVLEMHYNLAGLSKPVADQTKIRLQYAKSPVRYPLTLTLQADLSMKIPPMSQGHTEGNQFTVPARRKIWGVVPHMHKLGVSLKTELIRSGTPGCFVDIPRWDYNWQQTFFFKNPIDVNQGDQLKLTCVYDNPTNATVRWGDKTSDEMCLNFYITSAP
ncbi:MAG: hypothetical protein H6728_06915 [Myxococcales bacterium]|nr:hypothetical protein [Myxococcales bacterium]